MRHFKNVEVKSANRMKFSVGGHLFFASDNKTISIFNAYTLERLHILKINPVGLTEMLLSERDGSFGVVSPDGFVGHWTLPNYHSQEGVPERNYHYFGCDIFSTDIDNYMAVSGSDGFKSCIKVLKLDQHKSDAVKQFGTSSIQT